ncbi:hypothetical protein CVV65_16390 [Kyrpidia spormannii]|uniref:Uncharacterized protein n=1 Tax=Kyrpidia spormannii TaxID=2055160 RepID=A0A2K8NAE2_9BACL|nr:hypothetical protein [Kyrpidia spormannii]ATY86309.1 hypothetical protein CVV65_16390 [Kyrpidia spormannii]
MDAPLWIAMAWVTMRGLGVSTKRILLEMASTAALLVTGGWTWLHLDRRTVEAIGAWAANLTAIPGTAWPAGSGTAANPLPSLRESATFIAGGLTIFLAALLIVSAIHVALGAIERPRSGAIHPNLIGALLSLAGYTGIYYGLWRIAFRLTRNPEFAALLPWVKNSVWFTLLGSPSPFGG